MSELRAKPIMPAERATTLYAFVMEDANGDESFCACRGYAEQWFPCVGMDLKAMGSLRPVAEKLAIATNARVRLVEFTRARELHILEANNDPP